jgi:hypothetical protein
MINLEPGQAWEKFSPQENRWVRVIATAIEDRRVTLRYEGMLELVTVDADEMNNPDLFRRASAASP